LKTSLNLTDKSFALFLHFGAACIFSFCSPCRATPLNAMKCFLQMVKSDQSTLLDSTAEQRKAFGDPQTNAVAHNIIRSKRHTYGCHDSSGKEESILI